LFFSEWEFYIESMGTENELLLEEDEDRLDEELDYEELS
jgi:hypothetical protein